MLYVMLADWKPGLSREQQEGALARRAGWQYPAGAKVVGEFWPATHSPWRLTQLLLYACDHFVGVSLALGESQRSYAACSTRRRSRSKLARPYMERFTSLRRCTWPSTCP